MFKCRHCASRYVGRTVQHLAARIKQHMPLSALSEEAKKARPKRGRPRKNVAPSPGPSPSTSTAMAVSASDPSPAPSATTTSTTAAVSASDPGNKAKERPRRSCARYGRSSTAQRGQAPATEEGEEDSYVQEEPPGPVVGAVVDDDTKSAVYRHVMSSRECWLAYDDST